MLLNGCFLSESKQLGLMAWNLKCFFVLKRQSIYNCY